MTSRRAMISGLASASLLLMPAGAWAQTIRVVETGPPDHGTIDSRSSEFFVRFDKPIDHIHSVLAVTQGGKVVEKLQPRFKTEPEVLFAMAPTLPPGEYKLHWLVKTLAGADQVEGDISFTVISNK